MFEWVMANRAWLGYVAMAILGGAAGHLLSYEQIGQKLTFKQHVGHLCSAWVKAALIAALIFLGGQPGSLSDKGWSQPICHMATGLLSLFGKETLRALWRFMMKRLFGIDVDAPTIPKE